MAKKDALAKKGKEETGLMKWEDEVASWAQEASTQEQSTGGWPFLSVSGGLLMLNGEPVPGNQLDVVTVDFIYENVYYQGSFSRDNPQPPVCFAIGRDPKLAPHEAVGSKQHETCDGCPQNQWGSSTKENSRGKACKNTRRIALLAADDLEGDIRGFRPPVTSVKNWSKYVKFLAADRKAPQAVVTRIKVKPDPKNQFVVNFEPIRMLEPKELAVIVRRRKEVAEEIMFALGTQVEKSEEELEAEAKAKPSKGGAKKRRF